MIPKNTSSTIRKSLEKELAFIHSNITKYAEKYPSNSLVATVLNGIAEKSIQHHADRLSE